MPIVAADVTVDRVWEAGDRTGKFIHVVKECHFTVTTDGGTTGDMLASVLGFSVIYSAYGIRLINTNPYVLPIVTALDGSEIFTTVAGSVTPADVTGTCYVHIEGLPLTPT